MTAQNLETLKNAFLERNNDIGDRWATVINRAQNNGKSVSLKTWLQNHDLVETVQATIAGDIVTRGWAPGPREIDASRSTYATFDGSRRDYAGVTALFATGETWCGYNADMQTIIIYTAL